MHPFWSDVCQEAKKQKLSGNGGVVLYASHAATVFCFVIGIIFSGIWLKRWWRVKRSNAELLQSVWRFAGLFLFLSSATCVFGTAAWISKLARIPYVTSNSNYSSLDVSQCFDYVANELQASHKPTSCSPSACLDPSYRERALSRRFELPTRLNLPASSCPFSSALTGSANRRSGQRPPRNSMRWISWAIPPMPALRGATQASHEGAWRCSRCCRHPNL